MAVERAGPAAVRVAPHIAQQLFAREHAGRLGDQRLQQRELLGGQLDALLADLDLARQVVDDQRPGAADPRGRPLVGSAKQRADPSAQLRVGVRLAQHVVAAAVQHSNPVKLIDAGGQHDQRRVRVNAAGQPVALADRVDQIERLAVDVDDDPVGLFD